MDKLIVLATYCQTDDSDTDLALAMPDEGLIDDGTLAAVEPMAEEPPLPASDWQFSWRRYRADDQHWYGAPMVGDLDTLAQTLDEEPASVWLLLPSDLFVTRRLNFTKAERKHLRKLLPYQLEDQLVDDIHRIFVGLGQIEDGQVSIAYGDKLAITNLFNGLMAAHIDVEECLPLGLAMGWQPEQWSVALIDDEHEQAVVRWANDQAFGVDLALLAPALEALVAEQGWPQQINIIAETETGLDCLRALIPEGFSGEFQSQQRNVWQALDTEAQPSINLRQGTFARRLPIQKWWREWRTIAYTAAASLVVYLGTSLAAYVNYHGQFNEARTQIEQAYRAAVPNGALVDAERQLNQQLSKYETVATESNVSVLTMLQDIGPVLGDKPDIQLRNLSFVMGDMRLNLEAKTFQQLEQVRSDLTSKSLQAELLNVSRTGEGQQARLRVRSL